MGLSNITIEGVELSKINPIYYEDVSKKRLESFCNLIKEGKSLGNLITVEKDNDNSEYWLVGGYPEYLAYKKSKSKSKVTCLVRPMSTETEQRIELLKKMFFHQPTKWIDKFHLISKLIDSGNSPSKIAQKLKVTLSEIHQYIIHPDIPQEYINKAQSNNRSILTLDKIRRLERLNAFLKLRLYEKASLPNSDNEKLTLDRLQKIKWLLKCEKFFLLEKEQQWQLIEKALEYKKDLIAIWDKEINNFLNPISSQEEIVFRLVDSDSNYYQKYEI